MIFETIVVGLHLVTAHVGNTNGEQPITPGIYVRADGFTAGIFRNSYAEPSVHVGYTLETEGKTFALTLGATYGYRKKDDKEVSNCPASNLTNCSEAERLRYGWTEPGKRTLYPLIVPSVRLPVGDAFAARVSLMPYHKGPQAIHLSIERSF
jgi:hypothetical protein